MKTLFAAAAVAALLAAGPALAAASKAAESFMQQAQQGNQAEVDLGRIGQDKAQAEAVKGFAAAMVNDHGKSMDQLADIAEDKGVELAGKPDAAHQKKAEELQGLSGASFDQAFMAAMVQDHQKAVKQYQDAQKSIDDPEVKAYIDQTLPILQSHLRTAQQLYQPQAAGAGEKKSSGQAR